MNGRNRPGSSPRWDEPLANDDYIKRRLLPGVFDNDCLPFRDLLATVRHFAGQVGGMLFDYGCGGTPYREVFGHCDHYVAADIVAGPRVDRLIDASGLTTEVEGFYDVVFSSQVLEHVPEPAHYLAEAFRILKPGGALILTTHGTFMEHGCPGDFHRWTGYGLAHIVTAAGFAPQEVVKITSGVRASIYLAHIAVETAAPRHHWLPRVGLGIFRRAWRWTVRPLLNLAAPALEPRAFVAHNAPEPLYIGVGILARKPGTS